MWGIQVRRLDHASNEKAELSVRHWRPYRRRRRLCAGHAPRGFGNSGAGEVGDVTMPLSAPMRPISRRVVLQSLLAQPFLARPARAQSRVLAKPKTLAAGAVTHDWSSILRPTHNAVSTETKLSRTMPPPLVWEFPKGTSYSSPAVAGGRLMFIHRVRDDEVVECMDAETGASKWRFTYGTAFEDRYGY